MLPARLGWGQCRSGSIGSSSHQELDAQRSTAARELVQVHASRDQEAGGRRRVDEQVGGLAASSQQLPDVTVFDPQEALGLDELGPSDHCTGLCQHPSDWIRQ